MPKSTAADREFDWPVDSPLAIESYAVTIDLEEAFHETIADVVSQIRERLDVPAGEEPPSVEQVRAMFSRYQQARPPMQRMLSEMVVDMREE